jgi:hypothetical protein
MKMNRRFVPQYERGVALVLTLAILVIATILVVGFVSSMRTERQAATSLGSNVNASIISQSALDHAISILARNIPQPLGPGVTPAAQNWAINPGLLTTFSVSGNTAIPLNSGDPSGSDPNLNSLELGGTNSDILGPNNSPMRAAWVNLPSDPSKTASATNPIVGRYAFWIDDENSKININTAFGKPFPNPLPIPAALPAFNQNARYTRGNPPFVAAGTTYTLGHPASVELGVMPGLDATGLRNATLKRFFSSSEQVKAFVASGPQSFYETNKFFLTHFNADPEFNVFGKSRIFIADSMYYPFDYANTTTANPYWDTGYTYRAEPTTTGVVADATEPLIMHGYLMNDWNSAGYDRAGGTPTSDLPATNPAAAVVQRIANYLNTPWPGYPQSFVAKYGAREAEQIAWNIYGMAAASTVGNTTTQEGSWANTTYRTSYGAPAHSQNMRWSSFLWDGPLGTGARILPQTRSPLVSKVGVGVSLAKVSGSTTKYRVNFRVIFEMHLPSGYQGYQSTHSWSLGNDNIYLVHLEATINGQRVVLASTKDPTALAYATNGDATKMVVGPSSSQVLDLVGADPNDGDRKATPTNVNADFSTQGQTASPGSTFVARTWPIDPAATAPDAIISDVRLRFVAVTSSTGGASGTPTDYIPYQISPIRDIDGAPGFEAGNDSGGDPTKYGSLHFPDQFAFTSSSDVGGPSVWGVMQTVDPRVNQIASDWRSTANSGSVAGNADVGFRTLPPYPASNADGDESKLAFPDCSQLTRGTFDVHYGGRPHDTDKRMSSVGWLSCVSTGIQSGKPWRTLKFQPGGGGSPPDWLLMDLFAVPFDELPIIYKDPTSGATTTYQYPFRSDVGNLRISALGLPASLSYMNSTAGKVNINAKIFPDKAVNSNFSPPDRILPLQALFENMYRGTVQITSTSAISGNNSKTLASNVVNQVPSSTTFSGPYKFAGEICEVAGVADDTGLNEWDREAVVRNLGSLITTRSNAFSVWGVAQTVKKIPKNLAGAGANPNQFQSGDQVTGEKRFHAVIQRYVWPGVDGVVGNGQTGAGGYTQLGTNGWLASPTNATDGNNPSASNFTQSYNPQAAVFKYRVVSFKYLDE